MKTLLAVTEDFIKVERSELNADVSAGSTVTLVLINNDQIVDNDYIVIGHEGNELAELEQLDAVVSGNTDVRVATLKFNHKKGEPVTKYRYNQRKFYGSLTKTGSYTELTADGSPVDIQVDDPQGTLLEYTGNEGYLFFKATYYNSQTTDESAIADSDAVEADESKRYTSLYAIRKHAGLAGNTLYPTSRLEVKRKQAENEVNSSLIARYVLPLAEVPDFLSQIAELLAAGSIDYEEFGADGEGVKWLGEARGLLKAIRKGKQILVGADGTELARATKTGRLDGYPAAAPDVDTDAPKKFTINEKF